MSGPVETALSRPALLSVLSSLMTGRKGVVIGVTVAVLFAVAALSALAPLLAPYDPLALNMTARLRPSSAEHLMGTDAYGRDIFSRVLYGGRISLVIGVGATLLAVGTGLVIGLVSGFFRAADAVIMRIMDGLMAMPAVLLAVAIVALAGASVGTVLVAITIPEIPRVARIVRAVILSTRSAPFVEAARISGTRIGKLMWRHLIPSTVAPLLVQGSYVFASAILTEAVLSFLGVGISPDIPTWGNIMSEGRMFFSLRPGMIFWPALILSLVILAANMLGDVLRDHFDPRSKTGRA
ncbi:ABC transporter permease [Chachezhania sediminis]|uniref:ABC transporter permease n=1 Tax=Chachezhania sediminis TaxID=2599291 RepID=UPI00131C05A3|nr:ABC transporter permease [Chachezhania sediminis]